MYFILFIFHLFILFYSILLFLLFLFIYLFIFLGWGQQKWCTCPVYSEWVPNLKPPGQQQDPTFCSEVFFFFSYLFCMSKSSVGSVFTDTLAIFHGKKVICKHGRWAINGSYSSFPAEIATTDQEAMCIDVFRVTYQQQTTIKQRTDTNLLRQCNRCRENAPIRNTCNIQRYQTTTLKIRPVLLSTWEMLPRPTIIYIHQKITKIVFFCLLEKLETFKFNLYSHKLIELSIHLNEQTPAVFWSN